MERCHKYRLAQQKAEQEVADWKGKKASNVEEQPSAAKVESAGNASAFIPDSTSPTSALLVNARSDWTTDTGASSHMTPHRHWFNTYTPYSVPVKLADGQLIYLVGIGSVQFKLNGKRLPYNVLEFQNVLHVPLLQSNLLSVLFLTCEKSYHVSIVKNRMYFNQCGTLLFTATVTGNNTAILDGVTEPMC